MIKLIYKKRYVTASLKDEYLYYLGFAANERNLVKDYVFKYNSNFLRPKQYYSGLIACLLENYWDKPMPRLELFV